MKFNKILLPLVIIILGSGFSASTTSINYTLYKDFLVTIHGTSNLHDWDEKVERVTGACIVNTNTDGSIDLEAINIKMDVYSIKSESSVMNTNTYKALKAAQYPEIKFVLTSPIKSLKAASSEKTISAKGNITIAGVTKPVTMQINVFMPQSGKIIFEGSQLLKMTDYAVNPPVALFGALKTGDDITLNFKTSFLTNK